MRGDVSETGVLESAVETALSCDGPLEALVKAAVERDVPVLIEACGAAERVVVFDWSGRLDQHLDTLSSTRFVRVYEELLETGPPRRYARAMRALLRRTAAAATR